MYSDKEAGIAADKQRGKKLTKAQRQTLDVMDAPDTAYSSASVAHKRRERFGPLFINADTQVRVMRAMRELNLLAKVSDYSGDMWVRRS